MRGPVDRQSKMLFGVTTEDFVPANHPIRRIRVIIDAVLTALDEPLSAMYSEGGRRSIPPEHLIKGTLLMAFYSIRSERQFCERLQYDLLFKWFLGLNITDDAFDHSTFSKNRKRFLGQDLARELLGEVVREARRRHLISDEHFTVDGTLLQAWASQKSVLPRDKKQDPPADGESRNKTVDFRKQQRTNETHVSTTDDEARLARKGNGQESRLAFGGHILMENRNGLIVDWLVTQATGTAEREAALTMLDRREVRKHATLGADKAYDTRDFVAALEERGVIPHIAQNTSNRRSAVADVTASTPGYALSQRIRKRVEECFGWMKTVGGGRKLRYVGQVKNELWGTFTAVAFNLVRISNLTAQVA